MWNESRENNSGRIEQVGFPGMHSNVGGGYPKDQMAAVALDWMMHKAEEADLLLYQDVRDDVRQGADAHGKIYDSRAGLAAYYRYRPRDMVAACDDDRDEVLIKQPKVHVSALRRASRATEGYAPAYLLPDIKVVGTHAQETPLVQSVETEYANTAGARSTDCGKVAQIVMMRRGLYHGFLIYSLGILAAALVFRYIEPPAIAQVGSEAPMLVGYLLSGLEWLVPGYLEWFFKPLFDQAKYHWIIALAVIAVLPAIVLAKQTLERASHHRALDAWQAFRDALQPRPTAPPKAP